jgi:hypothetical protein
MDISVTVMAMLLARNRGSDPGKGEIAPSYMQCPDTL